MRGIGSNLLILLLPLFLIACGGGGGSSGASADGSAPAVTLAGFEVVTEDEWDELAVRKVLHAFAYGGRASDAQIVYWAGMPAQEAIQEMLTFGQHNLLLSPAGVSDCDRLDTRDGTLRGLSDFWAGLPPPGCSTTFGVDRQQYVIDGNSAYQIHRAWVKAATFSGLNPFRQKIGLWETNYHMATTVTKIGFINKHMMVRYYDDIMNAHEQGLPYQDVMSVAAKSAAVTAQYGHYDNICGIGSCSVNEDFAREYHQLFFGILGEYDPEHHEVVSIKNTANMLTDISILDENGLPTLADVTFGTRLHYFGPLNILNVAVGGSKADERIDELSDYAIEHPESLANLPVQVIRDLADDNLTEEKIAYIRNAWAGMPTKNLLEFLQGYAVSRLFHDPQRFKYLTSIDRHILMGNKVQLKNEEGYLRLYDVTGYEKEGAGAFFPKHNVFGGQRAQEAADSADVFRLNYNRVVNKANRYKSASGNAFGRYWEKDWGAVIPRNDLGQHKVAEVTEWLWNYFMADGLKNLGSLERAHIYALLGSGSDLGYLINPDEATEILTSAAIESDPDIVNLLDSVGESLLQLDSADDAQRLTANERIGMAVNFIVGTPYLFAQEGR